MGKIYATITVDDQGDTWLWVHTNKDWYPKRSEKNRTFPCKQQSPFASPPFGMQ